MNTRQFAGNYFDGSDKDRPALQKRIATSWDAKKTQAHLEIINVPKDIDSMLEVGCGIGRLAVPLLQDRPNMTYYGIDASRQMIAEAPLYCKSNRATFMLCDGEGSIPQLPHKVDFALSFTVFQHIQDTEAVMRYVKNMLDELAPNGQFCMQFLSRDIKPDNPLWVYHNILTVCEVLRHKAVNWAVKKHGDAWIIIRGQI